MRILITYFGDFSVTTAATNRLTRLSRALAQQGCTVRILAYARGKLDGQIDTDISGVSVSQIFKRDIRGGLGLRKNISGVRFLARELQSDDTLTRDYRTYSPDIIVAYTYFYELALVCRDAAEKVGADLFFDLVENFGFTFHRLLNGVMGSQRKFIDLVARKKCNVICVSRGWEQWARKHELCYCYCPGLLPFGSFCEFRSFKTNLSQPDENEKNGKRRYYVMMGLMGSRECAFRALMAFFILRFFYDLRFGLKLIGDQHLRLGNFVHQIAWRTSALVCADIEILGRLSEDEKNNVIHCSSGIILLRSNNKDSMYSFPTRLSEYVLFGKPVYLSDLNNFREIFSEIKIVEKMPLLFWSYVRALRVAISDQMMGQTSDSVLFSEGEKIFGWNQNAKRIKECFRPKIKARLSD